MFEMRNGRGLIFRIPLLVGLDGNLEHVFMESKKWIDQFKNTMQTTKA
jgi:hypothetical protein